MMDVGEMARAFRGAKDQREQINILADLNCCSPRRIAQALQDAGALDGTDITPSCYSDTFAPVAAADKRRSPGSKSWHRYSKTFDEAEARRLFDCGLCDEAIADRLHVAVQRIATWRRQNGLKRPTGFNRINDKRRQETMTKKTESAAAPLPEAPQPKTETASVGRVEPQHDTQQISARELETVLHRLLSQVLMDAPLAINGKPLIGVARLGVTFVNNQPYVDITLEGGAI